jgi:hypothetical protein
VSVLPASVVTAELLANAVSNGREVGCELAAGGEASQRGAKIVRHGQAPRDRPRIGSDPVIIRDQPTR